MGSVVKRGKMWHAVWTDASGKRRSKSISPRKRDAERFLARKTASEIKARIEGYEPVGFAQAAEEFIEVYAPLRYKPSTIRNYKLILKRRLTPYFGDMPVGEISPRDIETYLAGRVKAGASAATTKNDLVVLGSVLGQAQKWGYATTIATRGVKAPKYKSNRGVALSANEVRRLLDATPDRWRPLLATMALTGLRSGEAAALAAEDIDFANHLIHVRHSAWDGRVQSPKTPNSIRDIDLAPTLELMLKEWLASPMRPESKQQLVFPSSDGTIIDMNRIRAKVFHPALAAAGLPRIRLHDLRHTYATMLILQGESLKYVQEMLGHASISVTADIYGHLLKETHASAARKLDTAVFGTSPAD